MSISLERLQSLQEKEIVRIGLSASIAPLEEVAQFLVGNNRPCKIADVRFDKKTDLRVLCPVPDLINVSHNVLHHEMYS